MPQPHEASANAVERFVIAPARRAPSVVAVIDGATGRQWTRTEMADGVRRAAALLSTSGVMAEQRVMLIMADTPSFLWFFWGAMWIGAVPVPVSTMLTTKDYQFLLADSRATAVVISPAFTATALAATEGQPHLHHVFVDDVPLADVPGADPANIGNPFPAVPDDIAFWLYTSGTTGFPKAGRHRHADIGFCTDAYASGVLEMGPADRVYSVAKLFFAYGLGNSGFFPAGLDATVVLNPGRPVPSEVAEHVRMYRPTLFFGVPTFYAALLNADLPVDTFSSVRLAVSAGEPLPGDLHRRFRERFGVEVLDGIGTTEIAHIFVSNRPGRSRPNSSGTPVEGYEIQLRDGEGNVVPDGESGDLWVAGESVTVGYWNRTELNRRVLQGRFMATGDEYIRNEDGSYTYLGRTDDMLKVGGIWVSPNEVEATIMELDDVALAAVVGAPDPDGNIKPRAFVVAARPDVDPAALAPAVQAHVKARLAPFKYPRWVEVVSELPTTATGKIKRYVLREVPMDGRGHRPH